MHNRGCHIYYLTLGLLDGKLYSLLVVGVDTKLKLILSPDHVCF